MRQMILVAVSIAAALAPETGSGQQEDFAPALPRDGATLTFRNELIDAWDVTWSVGTPTPMHRHTVDYFGVELTASRTLLADPDGDERTVSLERGRLWFLRAGVTHAETGLTDDPPRHAIIVELTGAVPEPATNPTDLPTGPVDTTTEPTIDNERVTIWDETLPGDGAPGSMRFYDRPVILMFMESTEVEWTEAGGPGGRRSFAAGEVQYLGPGIGRALRVVGGSSRVIVAELKG